MKKISSISLVFSAIFLALITNSLAENSEDLKPSPSTSINSETSPNATKKLNTAGGTLESSSLIEDLQSGMASLLLGNKAASLMFDDKESDNIERAVDSFKSNQTYIPDEDQEEIKPEKESGEKEEAAAEKERKEQDEFNQKSYIYLASIMYSTSQDWVVWINDKKITSESNKKNKELFLDSVQKDKVSILWNVSPSKLKVLLGKKADDLNLKANENGQIEVRFSLQQNQTFMLGSNSVVEGKMITNMLKKKKIDAKKDGKTTDSTKGPQAKDLLGAVQKLF